MPAPIITLTTDFGTRDPWVGIMKGVILGICPEARLVDISHDIGPQDVLEGALCLEASARFFPRDRPSRRGRSGRRELETSPRAQSRRTVLRRSRQRPLEPHPRRRRAGRCRRADERGVSAVAGEPDLSRSGYFRSRGGASGLGVPLERLGPVVTDPVRLSVPSSRHDNGLILGEVIGADRFGNLLTSVTAKDLAALEGRGPPSWR